jgi:GT2 family glycosyltransferase
MESADGISIVIPTCGRSCFLRVLLKSILADVQSCSFSTEVILADSSEGSEKQSITQISDEFGASLLIAPRHIGEARNVGVRHAGFEFVLFLDSDVVICPGTLRAHYETLQAGADSCLGLVEFVGRSTFAWKVVESMQLMLPFRYACICQSVPWGPAANLSFRRSRLLAVGGFDPKLPPYGGEDVDLGFRFTDAGFHISTSKAAVARHTIDTWATWSGNIPKLVRYGRADFYLMDRYPKRTHFDIPSELIAFAAQVTVGIIVGLVYGARAWPAVIIALLASILAHHAVYALLKRAPGSSYWTHLPGPLIISLLDLGKMLEAIKNNRLNVILLRLKYLDDIVEKDWREIAASAWGVYASMLVFMFGLMLASTRSQ